jgi:hypothetical protein
LNLRASLFALQVRDRHTFFVTKFTACLAHIITIITVQNTIDPPTMRTTTALNHNSPSSDAYDIHNSNSSPMSCSSFPQHEQSCETHPNDRLDHEVESELHAATRSVLKTMKHLETTTYKRPLGRHQLPEPFNGLWRQQIVEWMYTLVKYCKLRHESAAAAVYYLDVAVVKGLIQSPNDYQLGAMTALYLALKVYDSPCVRVVKLSSLVKLGNGEFTEQDILDMERDLVKLLDWHLNPPTSNCFLQQYLTLLPQGFHGGDDDHGAGGKNSQHPSDSIRGSVEEIALQAIESTTARDYFLSIPPSVIAYSAMLFAIETLDLQHQQHHHYHHQPHYLSFLEFQTFLWNMSQVAELDTTSPTLMRASVLLDRTMKSLPIPASFMDDMEHHNNRDDFSSKSHLSASPSSDDVKHYRESCEDGYSPSQVCMH